MPHPLFIYGGGGENQMITDKKAYQRAYYQKHKEDRKAYQRAYRESHKDQYKDYQKSYRESHKEDDKAYKKADVNSFGIPKVKIRVKSNQYLKKHGTKIPGYQIHHCFTYDEPYKFIYCSIKKHLEIHKYLRENKIEAETNHYEQIKHLLDDTVIVYGV